MTQRIDLKNVNLYLIGLMGVGKSTTGQIIAQQLQYKFFDTDTLMAQLTGTASDAPVAVQTEAERRTLETQVLAQVSAYTQLVVATGANIVRGSANWSHLQQGLVVWLDLPVPILWERFQQYPTEMTLAGLEEQMQTCRHLYAQADVHLVIKPDWSPAEVANQVLAGLAKVIKTDTATDTNNDALGR